MFLEHSCEKVRLTVASCLSKIIALTLPLPPYNNDTMREILQLIVESLQGLNNVMLPTFQKQQKILELVAEFSFGTLMLNLECHKLIFQFLQNFYTSVTSGQLDHVKTCMQKNVSLLLKGDVNICKILRSKFLTIWRKEPMVSPSAYDLFNNLVMQNIKLLRKVLTRKDLRRIDGERKNKTCSKNELRIWGLCFICNGH